MKEKVIDLIHKDNSDVAYNIFKFNDGEYHIKFTEDINHKYTYKILTRITSMEDLFILLQVGDILERHGVDYYVYITYLMTMRMDRVMTFNESFSLKIISSILNNAIHPKKIYIYEAHSHKTYDIINNSGSFDMAICEIFNELQDYCVCYPDNGAAERYEFYLFMNKGTIVLNKTRDVETGNITGMEIVTNTNKSNPKHILIIDDLCDGGRTFIEAYKILREKYSDASIEIFVSHVVNPDGLQKLMNTFDKVYITDSYADYTSEKNLTVYKCDIR